MTLFDHIQYLITCHDCVVVSGLGAFVAQNMPARLSADSLTLLPPSRVLTFNNVISHDDGILAGSIARRDGITYEAAREELAREVELLRRRIEADGFVDIPRVGRLSATDGNALVFAPVASGSVADSCYSALPAVRLAGAVVAEEPVILEVDTLSHRIARRIRTASRYAAIVALLFAAGITLTTPIVVDDSNISQASLSVPKVTPARKAVIPVVPAATADRSAAAAVGGVAAPAAPAVIRVSELSDAAPDAYSCYIIVASCTSESEARRFIRNKDAQGLRYIHTDGRYRVYAAVSNDYDAAFRFKSTDPDFTAAYPSAWVYEKK